MNLELRTLVLQQSLQIESLLSEILAILFRFPHEGSRTLGGRSSALSFKTKVDLLIDLGYLYKDELDDFMTFMEIRNQLMHNMDCDTLVKAAERVQKLNKLLDFAPEGRKEFKQVTDESEKENILKAGEIILVLRIMDILKEIGELAEEEIQEEEELEQKTKQTELLTNLLATMTTAIGETSNEINAAIIKPDDDTKATDFVQRSFWNNFFTRLKKDHPEIETGLRNIFAKRNDEPK